MQDCTPTPYFPQDLENYAPWVTKHGLRYPYGQCQCGCGQKVEIAKQNREFLRKGHPNRVIRGHSRVGPDQPTLKDAFLARVSPKGENDCWIWEGHILISGYGSFKYGDTFYRAHRASYEIFKGPIAKDTNACHNGPDRDNTV